MSQDSNSGQRQAGVGDKKSTRFGFVELDRTFHELSQHTHDGDKFYFSEAFHIRGNLTWETLLKEFRAVILSEAGSGKTEETLQTSKKLRSQGKAAFFLRLEHIARDDLNDAFEVGSFEEFEAWLKSEDEGWLFLDSVDEARLRSPLDFAFAIRKLGNHMKIAAQRTHIFITGRTHAWRAKSDTELCETHLPYGAPTQTVSQETRDVNKEATIKTETKAHDEPAFKIVALDDFGRDQIERFARALEVTDTRALLKDLERADAWSFAARPQDLEEVISFWQEKGRIGSRLELMTASIARRLTEQSQDRAEINPLSIEQARFGARLAAAATTLAHNPIIQVPDGTKNKKGLPLQDVLSDWNNQDRSTLLSYPIFDEAIYATVRFHHLSVREYLTAEWLAELLKRSVSRRSIESVLFQKQYGMDVVVPTMRPILPWLAILDERVRERLRKISPEILFEGGDPSALPLQTRRDILAEVCEQIASDAAGMKATSYAAVQRFANHDIAKDIRALLKKYSANDKICEFLTKMIWLGRLTELLPEAMEIALSNSCSRYTRIAAFRAVTELGDANSTEKLRKHFLNESEELDREWLAAMISDENTNCEWFLASLAKAKHKEKHSVDKLAYAAVDFLHKADLGAVPSLMRGLSKLLSQEPFIELPYCQVSQKHAWLLGAAAIGAKRLIEARHQFALHPITLGILFGLRVGKERYSELDIRDIDLSTGFANWPELNRTAFWHDVDLTRTRMLHPPANRLTYFGQAAVFGAYWSFKASDFEYVCEQIVRQNERDNKLVALSLAFDLYVKEGRKLDWRRKLRKAASNTTEVEQVLNNYLRPAAKKDSYHTEERKWRRLSAERKRREEEKYKKSKEYLTTHVEEIREPKFEDPTTISSAQWYLHERLREKEKGLTSWTGGHWFDLSAEYGHDVAYAYRNAVVAYWRKYKPRLRSDGAAPNTTPIMVIFGLTGLSIESAESQNWPDALSEDDANLASRYACLELNGFPSWFPKLFIAQPKVASSVLLREIEFELSTETAEQEVHYVLSNVSWSGQWAWPELGPEIYLLLKKNNPANAATLNKLLTILDGSNTSNSELAELAARKIADKTTTHSELWYAVWVGAEPEKAIPALSVHLVTLRDAQTKTNFAMAFVISLLGGRRSEKALARLTFHTAEHLKTLYLLMHQYIRTDDDIERAGKGVYSPTLRDDAQKARNRLLDLLNKLSGKAAFLALQEIAQTSPNKISKGWITRLVHEKAEQDADLKPWTPQQVRNFNDRLDRTPQDHHELAEVAILRLLDLKDDLENGDNSVAGILQKVEQETEMRNYIARELREKSFGRYSIPQEEELADSKRPDLRFYGAGIPGPIPTELKLADANWGGPKLFERLENQLAGDYLRDINSGRGIFILVLRGERKTSWQHPDTRQPLNFDQLVSALQEHWTKISPRFPKIDDITVIGIDLSKRFKSPTN
jgi:hypothetical protein